MDFKYNDGGRAESAYKGSARDCVTRAIAIVTGKTYTEVMPSFMKKLKNFAATKRSAAAKKSRKRWW